MCIRDRDKGFLANFLITSGPIFDDKTVINENWIKGQRHIVKSNDNINVDGNYVFNINNRSYEVKISNSLLRPKATVERDSIDIKSKTSLVDDWLSVTLFDSIDGKLSFAQISSKITSTDNLSGRGINFNNEPFLFNISKNETEKKIQSKRINKDNSDYSIEVKRGKYKSNLSRNLSDAVSYTHLTLPTIDRV